MPCQKRQAPPRFTWTGLGVFLFPIPCSLLFYSSGNMLGSCGARMRTMRSMEYGVLWILL